MAENKMRVGIKYRVTKGNSDGSIFVGDVIMLDKDGDIVCDKTGWLEKDQLTPDVMDFEVEEADKNKMAEVARLFGKKLGEEFIMKWENEWGSVKYACEFTARGLRCYPSAENDIKYAYSNNDWLFLLLIGEAVIVDE